MKCIGNPVVRTDVRTDGRSHDYYVTTKISWLDRLLNFFSNGAPRVRTGSTIKSGRNIKGTNIKHCHTLLQVG